LSGKEALLRDWGMMMVSNPVLYYKVLFLLGMVALSAL